MADQDRQRGVNAEPPILQQLCEGLMPMAQTRIKQAYWLGVLDANDIHKATGEAAPVEYHGQSDLGYQY